MGTLTTTGKRRRIGIHWVGQPIGAGGPCDPPFPTLSPGRRHEPRRRKGSRARRGEQSSAFGQPLVIGYPGIRVAFGDKAEDRLAVAVAAVDFYVEARLVSAGNYCVCDMSQCSTSPMAIH
jgi:hypothetical protein